MLKLGLSVDEAKPRNRSGEPVSDPEIAVLIDSQRHHGLIAQSVFGVEAHPLTGAVTPDAGCRSRPDIAVRSLGKRKTANQRCILTGRFIHVPEFGGMGRRPIQAAVRPGPHRAGMIDQNGPEILTRQTVLRAEPGNLLRFGIEMAYAVGIGTQPQRTIRRGLHRMDRNGANRTHDMPRPHSVRSGAAKEAGFRADPDRAVGARQNLVHRLTREPTLGRKALPLPVTQPFGESAACKTQPDRAFAVLQHRIHRRQQAGTPADDMKARIVVNREALGCRNQQTPLRIDDGSSGAKALQRNLRALEARRAGIKHQEMPVLHHPQIPGPVPEDRGDGDLFEAGVSYRNLAAF